MTTEVIAPAMPATEDVTKKRLKDALQDILGEDISTKQMGMVHPGRLHVVGVDADEREEHPLDNLGRSEEKLDEGFVTNIFALGVLEPVIVRIVGKRIEVVDGTRRVLHAREASKRSENAGLGPRLVPIILRHGEAKDLAVVQASANQFVKPEHTVMQKARRAAHLLNVGVSEDKVAMAFGVSVSTCRQWTKLLTLQPKVIDAIDRNHITAAVAIDWVALEPGKQLEAFRDAMEKVAAGGSVSAAQQRRERTVKQKGEKSLRPSAGDLRKLVTVIDDGQAPQLARNAGFYNAIRWVLGGGESVVAGIPGLEDAWKAALAPKLKGKAAEPVEKPKPAEKAKPKAAKRTAKKTKPVKKATKKPAKKPARKGR
jgi:ParB family chromosome partitioning protein